MYDYVEGKADWLAFGLPHEASVELVADSMRADAPTCSYRERYDAVHRQLEGSPHGFLIALNDEGIVMGLLERDERPPDLAAEVSELMREGPVTVRPSEDAPDLRERMAHASVDALPVTDSLGKLLGVFDQSS